MARRYWLMKSDPDTFGLSHLRKSPKKTTMWDGVRNYQARNILRDEVRKGDRVLFYHSQVAPPAVVAVCEVVRGPYPDPTQFDPGSPYHDARSSADEPRWVAVDIRLVEVLANPVTLPEIKATPGLADMVLVTNSRLSVQPVTSDEWKIVTRMGRRASR